MPQPDRFTFDWDTPYPSVIIEAVRTKVLDAISGIVDNTGGVSDAYMLTDLLFDLLDQAFAAVTQNGDDLAALTARVAALEPPTEAPA